ncbi:MAG: N-acetylmuramoyl-L-alanine amidase [Bacteroidota bacterium]
MKDLRYITVFFLLVIPFLLLGPTCRQTGPKPLPLVSPNSPEYLIKDSVLYDFFTVDKSGISLFAKPEDKKLGKVETTIYPEEYAYLRRAFATQSTDSLLSWYQSKRTDRWSMDQLAALRKAPDWYRPSVDSLEPLKGLRIAIDPGHTAGKLPDAEIEKRYVKMRPTKATEYEPIGFWEANLTLGTAHLIRRELQALGATVLMTRTQAGKGVLGNSYQEWKRTDWEDRMREEIEEGTLDSTDLAYWKEEALDKDIMQRFFTQQDLRERARMINTFRPHLTLVIHFNIHGTNWEDRDKEGYFLPETANYLMSFVPGGFMQGELATPEDRLELLRLFLTEDLTNSIEISREFVQQSNKLTAVPIVDPDEELLYLRRSSILTHVQGVYARNLSLTRLVHGPIVYGESLCQDNLQEAISLNKKDLFIQGIWVSSRLEKVAEAYVNTVKAFAKSSSRPEDSR